MARRRRGVRESGRRAILCTRKLVGGGRNQQLRDKGRADDLAGFAGNTKRPSDQATKRPSDQATKRPSDQEAGERSWSVERPSAVGALRSIAMAERRFAHPTLSADRTHHGSSNGLFDGVDRPSALFAPPATPRSPNVEVVGLPVVVQVLDVAGLPLGCLAAWSFRRSRLSRWHAVVAGTFEANHCRQRSHQPSPGHMSPEP